MASPIRGIENIAKVERMLGRITPASLRSTATQAASAAARLTMDRARTVIPPQSRTGRLKNSLKIRLLKPRSSQNRRGLAASVVTASAGHASAVRAGSRGRRGSPFIAVAGSITKNEAARLVRKMVLRKIKSLLR